MPVTEVFRLPTTNNLEATGKNRNTQVRAMELGVPALNIVKLDYEFMGDAIPSEWQAISAGTAAAAIAISADGANGLAALDAGTDSGGYSGASLSRGFTAQRNATLWVYAAPDTASSLKMEIGFTDAHNDTGGAVNVKATPTFTATDFVGWVVDTNNNANWEGMSVAAGSAKATIAAAQALTTTGRWFGVMLREDGMARWRMLDAVASHLYDSGWQETRVTEDVLLTPWLFIINRTASQRVMYVDRVLAYQRRNAS